ncbi:helix-turn-helix domain-containing protein [Anaerospora hongkongensis]|uniref:helix-turn-helix domain-containing protein n=1 Tax=Anaerospora hongkongensis TaxID=244830 RepID=UPI00289B729F|nr:AraC family transcriptional regulator [Anaerospora hongkongensis]
MDMKAYRTGHGELADFFQSTRDEYLAGIRYNILPPGEGNSWIVDLQPVPGMIISNAYCILPHEVTVQYCVQQHYLWLCAFEGGDVTLVEQGKKAQQLKSGVIYALISQGKPYKMICSNKARILYTSVQIMDEFIVNYFQARSNEQPFVLADSLTWQRQHFNTPELAMAFEQIKYAVRRSIAPPMYFEGKVLEILGLIRCNIQHEWFAQKHTQEKMRIRLTYQNKKYIWQVKAALDKNILEPPSIQQLAVTAGMGPTRLRQRFKGLYGMTISEYIRREKMKYALQLLGNDDMSIGNIASHLGYKSASQFTAAFQRVHDVSPSQFRKMQGI